jgi:hypothetical protein
LWEGDPVSEEFGVDALQAEYAVFKEYIANAEEAPFIRRYL